MSVGHGTLHLHGGRGLIAPVGVPVLLAGSLLCGAAVLTVLGLAGTAVDTAVMAPARYPDPRIGVLPAPPAAVMGNAMRSPDGAIILPDPRRLTRP